MKKYACVILATIFMASPVMAADYVYKPLPNDHEEVDYNQGSATIVSTLPNTAVDLSYLEPFTGKRAKFFMVIHNDGPKLNVDVSDVSVTYGGTDLHVYTATELLKIVNGRAGWAKFAVAMAGALDEAAATTPTSVNTYGNIGGTSYNSHTTIYSTNYAAQAAAQNRTDTNLNRLEEGQSQTISNIHAVALQLNTVDEHTAYESKFVFDLPKKIVDGALLEIKVTLGDEVHIFDYDLTKQ